MSDTAAAATVAASAAGGLCTATGFAVAAGSPTITVSGGYRVYKWTGSGSITF